MLNDRGIPLLPNASRSRSLLFIHSLHLSSRCWEGWLSHYRIRGHSCHAPTWPYHAGDPRLKRIHHSILWPLTLAEIIEMYIFVIEEEIQEFPIIIGHGTGALIAQILASFGLAARCVCLAARRSETLIDYPSLWPSFLPRLLEKRSTEIPTFRKFHRYYANTLSVREARAVYDKHVYAEHSKTIQNFRYRSAYYDTNASSPILFISAEKDKMASPSLVQSDFEKYNVQQSGNLHRILQGYDHMSFFQEQLIPEIATLIDVWLSTNISGNIYLPNSEIGN